jgi:hypothetical protein
MTSEPQRSDDPNLIRIGSCQLHGFFMLVHAHVHASLSAMKLHSVIELLRKTGGSSPARVKFLTEASQITAQIGQDDGQSNVQSRGQWACCE